MLWVISLADIFCPGATKTGRWPEQNPEKLGHSLSPPLLAFLLEVLAGAEGTKGRCVGPAGGRSKKKTCSFPFVMQSQLGNDRVSGRSTNNSPYATFLTDL